jgi:predicted amidohydrolase YtcJ
MTRATAFVGGRVFTGRRYASALLVEGGEVSVVGTEAEVRRAAPAGTEVRQLDGGLLLPGLIDAHIHVAAVTRRREGLDVSGVGSVDALEARVREWGSAHPLGPVVGHGLDPEQLPGARWPSRSDLDRILRDRPLVLEHASGHALVANSAVLAAAHIDRATEDPPGGRFGRETDGTPDGRVYEAAVALLESRLPDLDRVEPDALLRTLRATAALGLTCLGAMSVEPEEAVGLRQLADSGRWTGRIRVYLRGSRWQEYFRDPGGPSGPADRFEVVGVKAFTDGAFGPRTALLTEPYADDPMTRGISVGGDDELGALISAAMHRGLAPALHAIGDGAMVRALGLLRGRRMSNRRRLRIEHASLTPPSLLPALDAVRPALVVQPGFVWSDRWLPVRLGRERSRWAYAFRTLLEHGHLLAGSSDAPYDPLDPWRGLQAAVQRTDVAGRSANPDPAEALDAPAALRMYTASGGEVFGEPLLGLLEPGAPADLLWTRAATLDAAISAGASVVRETWVDGERLAVGAGN